MREPWHALLAPLPPEARPIRRPVVPEEIAGSPAGAAVAGWSSLVLELSSAGAGLRVLQVLLDAEGRPLSASDHVHYRASDAALWVQDSLGGRFEPDGSFRGTRWHGTAPDIPEIEEAQWALVRADPEPHELARLRDLIAEIITRAGS
jgi:hypothetical protein